MEFYSRNTGCPRSLHAKFINVVTYTYAVLFIYAGASKLLDYENFTIQVGQSPLLSAFAFWVASLVPIFEFVIVVILFIPSVRLIGLYASYFLMALFTAYIYIILNYSAFVPCSCGGLLEEMTWSQHLGFNTAFMFIAILAIMVYPVQSKQIKLK